MNLDHQFNPNINSLQLEAKKFFSGHYNCAQATFLPFALRYGMSKDIAAKLALPFGGGMSQEGQVCGAVSGGVLAIGLFIGTSEDDPRQKTACYEMAKELIYRFKALHGEINCPGLLGYNLGNQSGKVRNRDPYLFQTPCSKFVVDTVEIVKALLSIEA